MLRSYSAHSLATTLRGASWSGEWSPNQLWLSEFPRPALASSRALGVRSGQGAGLPRSSPPGVGERQTRHRGPQPAAHGLAVGSWRLSSGPGVWERVFHEEEWGAG